MSVDREGQKAHFPPRKRHYSFFFSASKSHKSQLSDTFGTASVAAFLLRQSVVLHSPQIYQFLDFASRILTFLIFAFWILTFQIFAFGILTFQISVFGIFFALRISASWIFAS